MSITTTTRTLKSELDMTKVDAEPRRRVVVLGVVWKEVVELKTVVVVIVVVVTTVPPMMFEIQER